VAQPGVAVGVAGTAAGFEGSAGFGVMTAVAAPPV
jgi:hypothetical protein